MVLQCREVEQGDGGGDSSDDVKVNDATPIAVHTVLQPPSAHYFILSLLVRLKNFN